MSAIVQAAERGVGFALVPSGLTRQAFREGRLVQFFDHSLETGEAYYILHRRENPKLREVRQFVDWLASALGNGESCD
jgi:LysR family glycine cleavage system transcriptional activator